MSGSCHLLNGKDKVEFGDKRLASHDKLGARLNELLSLVAVGAEFLVVTKLVIL